MRARFPDPVVTVPADTTPPQVLAAHLIRTGKGKNKKVSGVELTFNEALNGPRAQDPGNYVVAELLKGKGRKGRTKPRGLIAATYDPAGHTVTLVPAGKVPFRLGAQVTVRPGVTDAAGNGVAGPTTTIVAR